MKKNVLYISPMQARALALEAAMIGVFFCVTIVGIPFGMQCFKLAKLSLMPFGAQVRG